jgi:predicted nucleic acid-binding protein
MMLFNFRYIIILSTAIRFGGQAGQSKSFSFLFTRTFLSMATIIGLTHTEITQLGFTRSLARFFLDNQIQTNLSTETIASLKEPHTIDELYELVHPDWTTNQVKQYSFSLKTVIDQIQVHNALVDLNPETKNLPSAHFDAESFVTANQRIIELRQKSRVYSTQFDTFIQHTDIF